MEESRGGVLSGYECELQKLHYWTRNVLFSMNASVKLHDLWFCANAQMLAATLLLTHTDEEQAFWVLSAVIDRMLPTDYYTPSLAGSRADQLVLAELVALHLPRLASKLGEMGVELASLTFGWFLSLFTDCLPVEVSWCEGV